MPCDTIRKSLTTRYKQGAGVSGKPARSAAIRPVTYHASTPEAFASRRARQIARPCRSDQRRCHTRRWIEE